MLLIIESDKINREALVKVFKWVDKRFRVTAVSNCAEGLALIQYNGYDLVIFDGSPSDQIPVILRKACPHSLLVESIKSDAAVKSVVDCVISHPPTRLEAIACCQLRKDKLADLKKSIKDNDVTGSKCRTYRLKEIPARPMTFLVALLEDPSARYGIPMSSGTSISAALSYLGKQVMPVSLIRNGKQMDCIPTDILQDQDLLLVE